jgi:hypothetical protein
MNPAPDLKSLRALISAVENPMERERYAFSKIPEGIPRGILTEITGLKKVEFVLKFLAENKRLRVAWIEEELTIYPLAFLEHQVSLSRVLFIEAKKNASWSAFQILSSGFFECVVMTPQKQFDQRTLRRFQLEAEKSHAGIFFLTEKPHGGWPISLKIAVNEKGEVR